MKIIRNNEVIELTDNELEQAYREREKYYTKLDVLMYCEINGVEEKLTENDVENIAKVATDILENSDPYWEAYWEAFSQAFNDCGVEV